MHQELSLDDLFREAKAAMRQEAKTVKVKLPDPATEGIYKNPAYWIKSRCVALLHEGTKTLLGNFTEYRHKTEPGTRKLIRETEPGVAEAIEYVNGDWWMKPEEVPQPKRLWKEQKLVTLPYVQLRGCATHAREVSVYAVFGEGSLDRVDLAAETIFGGGSVLMTLPAGVDILRELLPVVTTHILTQLEQPV